MEQKIRNPLRVYLYDIAKRYEQQFILKSLDRKYEAGEIYGLAGPNGAGKSTLMKIISGYLNYSSGKLEYWNGEQLVQRNEVYTEVSYVAPYMAVTDEFSLEEMFVFQQRFKAFRQRMLFSEFLDTIELKNQGSKPIKYYSSGMQQKIKLGLSILADSSLLLIDEPTSYLDSTAKAWFLEILGKNKSDRTVIIASNDVEDFFYCTEIDRIYKGQLKRLDSVF
jgi:ABC-type multidrug transport system ATPase subunit